MLLFLVFLDLEKVKVMNLKDLIVRSNCYLMVQSVFRLLHLMFTSTQLLELISVWSPHAFDCN